MTLITRRRKKVSGVVFAICMITLLFVGGMLAGMNLPDTEIEYTVGWIHSAIPFESPSGGIALMEGACLVKDDVMLLQEAHPDSVVTMLSPETTPPPERQSF